jgi:hypothetical protein
MGDYGITPNNEILAQKQAVKQRLRLTQLVKSA